MSTTDQFDTTQQLNLWRAQASAAPNLKFGKDELFLRTSQLVSLLYESESVEFDAVPLLPGIQSIRPWRHYLPALRTMGLVENRRGRIFLTADGKTFEENPSKDFLATLLARKIRLFGESLDLVIESPKTIKEIHSTLVNSYNITSWKTVANVRARCTWLEALGLVEWLGANKIAATNSGRKIRSTWQIVSPESLSARIEEKSVDLPQAPSDIQAALENLKNNPRAHELRSTYNIWVPSPSSDPSKIENMRTCVAAAMEPINKEDLLVFIQNRFNLRRSSVDSMMPFMRGAGLIQEIRKNIYVATPLASSWIESGSYVDFIRILHVNMKFVGEIVDLAVENISRNQIYISSVNFGMNKEKTRWLISFLVEAGLVIESSWSSVQSTSLGKEFIQSIPLAQPDQIELPSDIPEDRRTLDPSLNVFGQIELSQISNDLIRFSREPSGGGMGAGAAFESMIEKVFSLMGFNAHRISGSGDTDVVVQWVDFSGNIRTAIVDAKSTSTGSISHTSVSDVAISAHKEKHDADRVAILAPSFVGETIREISVKKQWSLITAEELSQLLSASVNLGLSTAESALVFEFPDGISRVAELIESRQRTIDLITMVIARFREESDNEESLSARDISLIERRSSLAPTVDELINTINLLNGLDMQVLRTVEKMNDPKHQTYQLGEVRAAANQLRSLASALENGLSID